MIVGGYRLELVDATTKQPFKEHLSATGECYVEVEPNAEYFIRLNTNTTNIKIKIDVDGVDLGYVINGASTFQDYTFGSWERKSGMSQMTALRFNLARLAQPGEGISEGQAVTGRVDMSVYELGPLTHIEEAKDYKSNASTALEQSFQTKTGGKKCIMSTQGTTTQVTKEASNKSVHYATGPLLQTVTLNYCTAAGLVLNKILGPPPKEKEEEDVDIERPRKRVKPEKKRRSGDVKPDVVDLTNPFIDKKKPGPPETIDLT